MLQAGQSFHAYPSTTPNFPAYDRSIPMPCDQVEHDSTGCYNPSTCRFTASVPMRVQFFGNVLWKNPVPTAYLTLCLFKNGVEIEGTDLSTPNGGGNPNQGQICFRIVTLAAGDYVTLNPCIAQSGGDQLANAGSDSIAYNDCNFFEGVILELL